MKATRARRPFSITQLDSTSCENIIFIYNSKSSFRGSSRRKSYGKAGKGRGKSMGI
jgi:hypothetical protein